MKNIGSTEDYKITVSAHKYINTAGSTYEWYDGYDLTNKMEFISGTLDPDVPEYGGLASPAVGKTVEFILPFGDTPDTTFFRVTVFVYYPKLDQNYYYYFDYKYDAQKVAAVLGGSNQASSVTTEPTVSKVLVDGKETGFDAYTINGNNYVKLRDLGQLFDFGVRWENAVVIDTSVGYIDANAGQGVDPDPSDIDTNPYPKGE